MKPKPYVIAGPFSVGKCVAKITYGDKKYVIVKCKEAYSSLKRIENGLNAFIRGGANNPEGIYHFFYNHIAKNPDQQFKVEILLENDSAYLLLQREQEELDNGRKNRNFMNNQTAAYIPMYNDENKAYGWIPPIDVLNFKNWLSKRKQVRAPRKKKVSLPGA